MSTAPKPAPCAKEITIHELPTPHVRRGPNASTQSRKAQSKRLLPAVLALALLWVGTFLPACKRRHSIDILSRTEISGSINNAAFKGSVTATINTGRGGRSACVYEQLPPLFTPGTLGTHA